MNNTNQNEWRRLCKLGILFSILTSLVIAAATDATAQDSLNLPFSQTLAETPKTASKPKQHYVLLTNGNVFTGQIERAGHWVVIHRSEDSALRVPSNQVVDIKPSLDGLYQLRIGNRHHLDLQQIHDDIRWSLKVGLLDRAAEDAIRAKKLDPHDPLTKHYLKTVAIRLQESLDSSKQIANASGVRNAGFETNQQQGTVASTQYIQPASEGIAATPSNPIRYVPLSSQNKHWFATSVHSVLVNRCASCHRRGPDSPSDFQLSSRADVSFAAKNAVEQDLAAVLRYVDRLQPQASGILVRSGDGHGGKKGTLGGSPELTQRLRSWVFETAAELRSQQPSGPAMNQSQTIQQSSFIEFADDEQPASETQPQSASSGIRRMPQVTNPNDPSIFNRRVSQLPDVPQ